MKINIFLICFLFLAGLSEAQNTYHLIPYPNTLVEAEGHFEIKSSLTVTISDLFKSEMELMTSIFADEYKVDLLPTDKGKLVVKHNPRLAEEAYTLNVTKEKIVVEASTATGCFWAFQTIRQLMTLTGNGSYTLSACQIEDQPAYSWRGLLLDEARNFKGKEAVKVLIDQMSYMKMNVFQWHLTDDQGWRIEIKKYPLLTEIGAWRDSTNITTEETGWNTDEYDPLPHGGFYTQAEIKEIVLYAAKRHITIVPEIDLPGHSMAAMAAYPWLGVNDEPVRVRCSVGDITPGTLDIADEKVFRFIEDVMNEVMALFPGGVIHSGGDEADYGPWKESKAADKLMKAEGLNNHSDLQMYFSNRLTGYLEKHGTRMMGWNEILGKNIHTSLWDEADATHTLGTSVIVQFWAGDPKQINEAMEKGYDVVNSHSQFSYLNYSYNSISLEKAYGFVPTPSDINPELAHHLLGPEVAVWGERLFTLADLYRQVFPRLAASSEVGWTKESEKNFDRFKESLNELKRVWEFKGILYYEEY